MNIQCSRMNMPSSGRSVLGPCRRVGVRGGAVRGGGGPRPGRSCSTPRCPATRRSSPTPLRRADHHVHQPAHRQLRRQRHRLRGPPAVLPRSRRPGPRAAAEQPAVAGRSRRDARALRHPRDHRHRHPSADPADPRDRSHAGRVRARRRRSPTLRSPRAGEPGTDGIDLVANVTTAEPYTVGAAARSGSSPTTTGSSARSCATSPGSARSRSSRRRRRPPTSSPATPTGCSCPTGPATRPA